MKFRYALLMLPICLANVAYAEANNFEGFALELSGGYQKTDNAVDGLLLENNVVNTNNVTHPFDESDITYAAGISYNFAISKNYLLGVGFDYNLNDIEIGTSRNTRIGYYSYDFYKFELKDFYSIYIKPQLVIDDDKVVYAKLGYVGADLSYAPVGSKVDTEFDSASDKSLNGYTIGVGYKQLITPSLFGFFEASYTDLGKETALSNHLNASNANTPYTMSQEIDTDFYAVKVGVGYQF